MEVLNVTYHCKEGMREEFLGTIIAEGIDKKCRAENGNIKYDYYFAADDENELFLVEKWENADVLAVHMQQDHFKRLGELKEQFVEDTEIMRFHME